MFDLLLQSQKSLSAAEVARELGASEDGMERLLDALVGVEVLEVELTQGTGTFTPGESGTVHRRVYCRWSWHELALTLEKFISNKIKISRA